MSISLIFQCWILSWSTWFWKEHHSLQKEDTKPTSEQTHTWNGYSPRHTWIQLCGVTVKNGGWFFFLITEHHILNKNHLQEILLHGSQPYPGESACVTQETISHAVQGYPRWIGHNEEFWQNMVHWRNKWQNPSSILARRTPWIVWKGKKIWHWKMSLPGGKVSNMLLGNSRG